MERYYKRTDDIDQKIHSVKLPYLAWKVLFLVDEKQSISDLKAYLEEEESAIENALKNLEKEGLILTLEAEEPAEPISEEKAPPKEETKIEEAAEEIKEEIPEEEPETGIPEIFVEPENESEKEAEIEDFDISELSSQLEDQEVETKPEEKTEAEEEQAEAAEPEIEIELPEAREQDEGVKFDLELDKPEQLTEETAEEAPAVKEETGEKTILVIDDSIVIRKMVELALEEQNYRLETAVTGKDGLKALDDVKPDLIILDLMLPDINGIDLLKTIKASLGIPVIMLSGKDSPQMIEKAKAEGADAFLPKPFRDEELVQNIKKLLNE
ncbi:MAG: response regulator [Calditrichaeota bacterium]|nr:response regulator [Calditrichota bacterium]